MAEFIGLVLAGLYMTVILGVVITIAVVLFKVALAILGATVIKWIFIIALILIVLFMIIGLVN